MEELETLERVEKEWECKYRLPVNENPLLQGLVMRGVPPSEVSDYQTEIKSYVFAETIGGKRIEEKLADLTVERDVDTDIAYDKSFYGDGGRGSAYFQFVSDAPLTAEEETVVKDAIRAALDDVSEDFMENTIDYLFTEGELCFIDPCNWR